MHRERKLSLDHYGGALIALIGLCALYGALHYNVGTLAEMGPGFFPTAIGALLAMVGLSMLLRAWLTSRADKPNLDFDFRGAACITGGVLAFIALGDYGGLVPATFALVFISALGNRSNSVRQACGLALVMVAVAVVIFRWALQLQLSLFAWSG